MRYAVLAAALMTAAPANAQVDVPESVKARVNDLVAQCVQAGGALGRMTGQGRFVIPRDFNGDGRYDGASANGFVAGSASVLTNIGALAVLRGDGNLDDRVSAADLVALARELPDNATARADQARRGSFPAGPGIDANGDGLVTAQDAAAITHRVFAGF